MTQVTVCAEVLRPRKAGETHAIVYGFTSAEAVDQPRVLTQRNADRISVYEAFNRWLNREPSFVHEDDPNITSKNWPS